LRKDFRRFLDLVDRGNRRWQEKRNSRIAAYHYRRALELYDNTLKSRSEAIQTAVEEWLARNPHEPSNSEERAEYQAYKYMETILPQVAAEILRLRDSAIAKLKEDKTGHEWISKWLKQGAERRVISPDVLSEATGPSSIPTSDVSDVASSDDSDSGSTVRTAPMPGRKVTFARSSHQRGVRRRSTMEIQRITSERDGTAYFRPPRWGSETDPLARGKGRMARRSFREQRPRGGTALEPTSNNLPLAAAKHAMQQQTQPRVKILTSWGAVTTSSLSDSSSGVTDRLERSLGHEKPATRGTASTTQGDASKRESKGRSAMAPRRPERIPMTERNFRDQPAKRRRRGRFRNVIREGALVVNDPVGRFSKYDEKIAKLRTFAEAMNAPMRTGEKWKLRDIRRKKFWQDLAVREPMAFETETVSDTASIDKVSSPTSTTASTGRSTSSESTEDQSGSEGIPELFDCKPLV
jgi:hypothetical protein